MKNRKIKTDLLKDKFRYEIKDNIIYDKRLKISMTKEVFAKTECIYDKHINKFYSYCLKLQEENENEEDVFSILHGFIEDIWNEAEYNFIQLEKHKNKISCSISDEDELFILIKKMYIEEAIYDAIGLFDKYRIRILDETIKEIKEV